MLNLNRVALAGRLVNDAAAKGQEGKVVKLLLAVCRKYKDRQGEWQTETHQVEVVAFGYAAKDAAGLTAGTEVLIDGRLAVNRWKDQQGKEHNTLELVAENVGVPGRHAAGTKPAANQPQNAPPAQAPPDIEDVPF